MVETKSQAVLTVQLQSGAFQPADDPRELVMQMPMAATLHR